jgi:hypothetical protein
VADAQMIRSLAQKMGNYRFAQGQARERGENDKAGEYADEADKAWRELCRVTDAILASAPKPEADTARLDWLERQDMNDTCLGFVHDAPHDGEYVINVGDGPHYGKTLRAAIDAAMHPTTAKD